MIGRFVRNYIFRFAFRKATLTHIIYIVRTHIIYIMAKSLFSLASYIRS
ncbi:hypothetical protein EVA_16566 [gut metagenome]|uniref:Uncharacterized protein n=1 Tax=gut metagenome TaxID=749906 RepID=J9FLL7_9ZZZZ